MKITALYVYPIKALRGIPLPTARLAAQGLQHDRRFMLFEHHDAGPGPDGARPTLRKLQLDSHPECALFSVAFEPAPAPEPDPATGDTAATATATAEPTHLTVRYLAPADPVAPHHPAMATALRLPLRPDAALDPVVVDLHGSVASRAYAVRGAAEAWFSACLGRRVVLVYLGDGARAILGRTLLPSSYGGGLTGKGEEDEKEEKGQEREKKGTPAQGWLGWAGGIVLGRSVPGTRGAGTAAGGQGRPAPAPATIAFSDVAPLLVVSEASVRDVSARLPEGEAMDVRKFRPNIVVDGAGEEAFAEDFWGELALGGGGGGGGGGEGGGPRLVLTGACARCVSLNVDYDTGRFAEGEAGTVLKKLMRDRRVDKGAKWSPVFGRYASLRTAGEEGREVEIRVGQTVRVTSRLEERTTTDWPVTESTLAFVAAESS